MGVKKVLSAFISPPLLLLLSICSCDRCLWQYLNVPHLFLLKPGEDLDWDEEFALQDFLKREPVEPSGNQETGRRRGGGGEEEDGEERWTVVEKTGEAGARDTSTPLSAHPEEARPGLGAGGEGNGERGEELGGVSAVPR